MNTQDSGCTGFGSSEMMARWRARGGAAEALAGDETAHAGSRRADAHGDDGLQAALTPSSAFMGCGGADEGLAGGRFTTHPFACAGDGLHASNITRGYGCIPPSVDDGPTAGGSSYYGCRF